MPRLGSPTLFTICAAFVFGLYSLTAMAGDTTLVSVSSNGTHTNSASGGGDGDGDYYGGGMSADGRFVVFDSYATNLVAGDTNNESDIFVHDRLTKQTSRVSISSSGRQGNRYSHGPHISGNGRYVAFTSGASNLVPGDNNGLADIFVHDRQTKQTTRVNTGVQAYFYFVHPSLNADGRFVAFTAYADNQTAGNNGFKADIFVHDRQTKLTSKISRGMNGLQANGSSEYPILSADGRFVVFESDADNLVAGDTNGEDDVFIHDRQSRQTFRVSVDANGKEGNSSSRSPRLSADGRYIVFESVASNLIAGDTNNANDLFCYDRQTKKISLISKSSSGQQGNGFSSTPDISADGRFIAFLSIANNLVENDTNEAEDIFIHDRLTKQTSRVSTGPNGLQGNSGSSYFPHLSADGRYVTFMSYDDNLVANDSNHAADIFVHDRLLDKAHSADLKIKLIQKPANLKANSIGTYQFTVTNQGKDLVNNVRLTYLVSNGSQVLGFIPSQGNWNRYSSISLCQFGKLLPGETVSLVVVIKASNKPVTQNVYVNASPVDKVPTNNYLTIKTDVTP